MSCVHVGQLGKPGKKLAGLVAQAEECRQPNCGSDPYDLYICLHEGCGVVSCGRNSKGHAQAHYERAGHPVAMQVKSGMIWCYSCDQQVVENDRGPGDFNKRIKEFRAMAHNLASATAAPALASLAPSATLASGNIPTGDLFPSDFFNSRAPSADSVHALTGAHSLVYPNLAGLTGLQNMGNTCFLAAALQALANVPAFAGYFSEVPFAAAPDRVRSSTGTPGDPAETSAPRMAAAMRALILNLWDIHPRSVEASGVPPYRPNHVLTALRKLSPLFEGFSQQDSHEALRTILNELHERLAVDMPVGLYSNDHGAGESEGPGTGGHSGSSSVGGAAASSAQGHSGGGNHGGSAAAGSRSKASRSGVPPAVGVSLRDLRKGVAGPSRSSGRGATDMDVDEQGDGKDNAGSGEELEDEDEGMGVSASQGRASARGHAGSGAGVALGREWLHEGPYTGPDVIARSIVTDLFQGQFCSRVRCRTCKTHSITYEPFLDLSLPLPKARHPISKGGDGSVIPPEATAWMKEGDAEAVMAELEAASSSTSVAGISSSSAASGSGGGHGGEAGGSGGGGPMEEDGPVVVSNSMRAALDSAAVRDGGSAPPSPSLIGSGQAKGSEGGGLEGGESSPGGLAKGGSPLAHSTALQEQAVLHDQAAVRKGVGGWMSALFCLVNRGNQGGAAAGSAGGSSGGVPGPVPTGLGGTAAAAAGSGAPGSTAAAVSAAGSGGGVLSGLSSAIGLDSGLGLADVMYNFFGWEELKGSDQYSCEVCGKKVDADRRVSIAALPEVLVLHLKRFSYHGWGSKNSVSVAFPFQGLDMQPFCWEGAHTQAVRSFTRAKEQQVGRRLGGNAGQADDGVVMLGGGAGAVPSSDKSKAVVARPSSVNKAHQVKRQTTGPARTKVLLEMSPDSRAAFLHRHSISLGPSGVEAVVAESSALQHVIQAALAASKAHTGSASSAASAAAAAAALDEGPITLRFPASFAAAYLQGQRTARISEAVHMAAAAASAAAKAAMSIPRQPSGPGLLPLALTSAIPVPLSRRVSPTVMGSAKYDCTAVVQHMGVLNGGHYVAHARNRVTGKWYTFDDSVVTQQDADTVARKEGYILFFTRCRPQSGPLARAQLPAREPGEAAPFYVSRGWWLRYKHLTVPGPITNSDILCDHGCLKNDLENGESRDMFAKHAVALTARQYEALALAYGAAEPPLRSLEFCSKCRAEAEALKRRRQRERERITKVDSTTLAGEGQCWYLVSEHWLARWRAFINDQAGPGAQGTGVGEASHTDGTGRGVLPPGPIDNARLLGKDGRPLKNLRPSMHYRGVNESVWRFLQGIYGGGPTLRRREISIYQPEAEAKTV